MRRHAFREYDRWLITRRFSTIAPDVLIVSTGLHDCYWNESLALGAEYHAAQTRAYLSFLSAYLPKKTRLIWLSAQMSMGPHSDFKLPSPPDADWYRKLAAFFPSSREHMRCVQAVNRVAEHVSAPRWRLRATTLRPRARDAPTANRSPSEGMAPIRACCFADRS